MRCCPHVFGLNVASAWLYVKLGAQGEVASVTKRAEAAEAQLAEVREQQSAAEAKKALDRAAQDLAVLQQDYTRVSLASLCNCLRRLRMSLQGQMVNQHLATCRPVMPGLVAAAWACCLLNLPCPAHVAVLRGVTVFMPCCCSHTAIQPCSHTALLLSLGMTGRVRDG